MEKHSNFYAPPHRYSLLIWHQLHPESCMNIGIWRRFNWDLYKDEFDDFEEYLDKPEKESLLKVLTERERKVLNLRYGIVDGKKYTLKKIGSIFNVSKERIRQIEKWAIIKLKRRAKFKKIRLIELGID